MKALAGVFDRGGPGDRGGATISRRGLWGKAVVNAAINPLTALWRVPNGALLATADRRWLLARLVEEAATSPARAASRCRSTIRWRYTEIDLPEQRGQPLVHAAGRRARPADRDRQHQRDHRRRRASGWACRYAGQRGGVAAGASGSDSTGWQVHSLQPDGRQGSIEVIMQVVETVSEVRRIRRGVGRELGGWCPRWAFCTPGTSSLVERARAENDHVGVSIFVNPTQFGPTEDLAAYPRDLAARPAPARGGRRRPGLDAAGRRGLPAGFQTYVTVEDVTKPLEGAARPTHFRGVATVVAKLFNVFQPDRAYFGQKDAQQVVVIQQMVARPELPAGDRRLPHRARAGRAGAVVAQRLPDARAAGGRAGAVPRAAAAAGCLAGGRARRRASAADHARRCSGAEPLAQADYVSAADPLTLAELGDAAGGVAALDGRAHRQGAADRQHLLLGPDGDSR